jgi:hypothetical protein
MVEQSFGYLAKYRLRGINKKKRIKKLKLRELRRMRNYAL